MRCLLLILLFAQGSPQDLIELLRSDRADVRERAFKQLKELGKAAVPDLQRATRDPDPEVAGRATAALRVIALRESLSPDLRKAFPGVEDRLAGAADSVYAEVFLEACEHEDLKPADYEGLAAPALRGAAPELIRNVLSRIMADHFVSAGPEVVKLLRNQDMSLAEFAGQVLLAIDRPAAKAANLSLLEDPNPQYRFNGIRRLIAIGDVDVVPRLVELLSDKEAYVRQWVFTAFGQLGADSEVPRLLAALRDENPTIQEAAANALITLDPPDLSAKVRPLFQSTGEGERLQAVRIVSALNDKEMLPSILKQLPSKNPEMRKAVAWSLADLHATENGAALIPLLRDENEEVRSAALWAVGALRIKEAGADVVKLVADAELDVRRMACWVAGRLELREAIPGLLKTLADPETDVAATAAWPLGVLKVKEALPRLMELSKDDATGGYSAISAAAQLMELPSTADVMSCLENGTWRFLWAFGPAVRAQRPRDLSAALIKRIENDEGDEDERQLAIDAVKEFRIAEAVPILLKTLRNEAAEGFTRGKAAEALGRLKTTEALAEICAMARKQDNGFRSNLISAMAEFGTKDVVADLRKFLKDPDDSVILAAVGALEQLDAREALEDVVPFLQRDVDEVRTKAVAWLCHSGRREGAEVLLKSELKLIPANALRCPDAWKKLARLRYVQDLEGSSFEILERLAKDAGLTLQCRFTEDRDPLSVLLRRIVHVERDFLSGADVLEALFSDYDSMDVDIVLEESVLRVVSSTVARRSFQRWLASTQKR